MAGNLTRFNPFREIARMDPFSNIDELMKEFSIMPSLRSMEAEPRIRMDVSETDQAYLVKADLPGVKKEDIKVSVDGNVVSISATAHEEKETREGNAMCSERYYGEQYRRFALPGDVDDAAVEAKYQDGVLHLMLPKKEGGNRRQITIQ